MVPSCQNRASLQKNSAQSSEAMIARYNLSSWERLLKKFDFRILEQFESGFKALKVLNYK